MVYHENNDNKKWSDQGWVYKANFFHSVIFPIVTIIETQFSWWRSHLCLTGVTAAQLQLHLSNMNVIKESNRYFCKLKILLTEKLTKRALIASHLCHLKHWEMIKTANIMYNVMFSKKKKKKKKKKSAVESSKSNVVTNFLVQRITPVHFLWHTYLLEAPNIWLQITHSDTFQAWRKLVQFDDKLKLTWFLKWKAVFLRGWVTRHFSYMCSNLIYNWIFIMCMKIIVGAIEYDKAYDALSYSIALTIIFIHSTWSSLVQAIAWHLLASPTQNKMGHILYIYNTNLPFIYGNI